MILDSGNRREFSTGAVRDMEEGKGRCDLLPMEVVIGLIDDSVLDEVQLYLESNNTAYLYNALVCFARTHFSDVETMLLEVAKHFEEGAKKYGDNNWRRGIPANVYIDSAVRHFLKFKRGDSDERHDRAFCWNLMCCIWEVDFHHHEEEQR